jgi:hypothetical protein
MSSSRSGTTPTMRAASATRPTASARTGPSRRRIGVRQDENRCPWHARRRDQRAAAGPTARPFRESAAALGGSRSVRQRLTTARTSARVARSANSACTRTVTSTNGSAITTTRRRQGRADSRPPRAPAFAAHIGRAYRRVVGALRERPACARRRSAAGRAGFAARGGPRRGSGRWDRCGREPLLFLLVRPQLGVLSRRPSSQARSAGTVPPTRPHHRSLCPHVGPATHAPPPTPLGPLAPPWWRQSRLTPLAVRLTARSRPVTRFRAAGIRSGDRGTVHR